jgi:hypothetical protein
MALVRFFKFDTDGFPVEHNPATDELNLLGLQIGANGIDMNGNKITELGAGVAATDAINKGQLDAAVITGGTVKERILASVQLSDTLGIYAAEGLYLANQPVSGDNVVISDGTTTRTYQFGAGGDVTVTIGGTTAISMQNLAAAITADGSGAWDAYFSTELDQINAGGVITVYENTVAAGVSTSRIYGVFTTQADLKVVEFQAAGVTDTEYDTKASVTASTTDPASGRFGFRRLLANLKNGEIHNALENDSMYSWDDDDNVWVTLSGAASVPDATSGSGGAIKGKVTFDSDKGLVVVAGVAAVKDGHSTISFDSSGNVRVDESPNTVARQDSQGNIVADGTGVTKGYPLFISAAATVSHCNANNDNTRKYIGVAAATAGSAAAVGVQQDGIISGVTIAGSPAAGDIVYLAVGGGLTKNMPTSSGDHRLVVGKVVRITPSVDMMVEPQYLGKIGP